jgi:hypothetical protein
MMRAVGDLGWPRISRRSFQASKKIRSSFEAGSMDRYAGKPFLRLLDCYVLNAIGKLDSAQEQGLVRMAPKLSETFGVQGSWVEIVEAQMDFPAGLTEQILAIWGRAESQAKERGITIDPIQFVMDFVDENFMSN